MNADGQGGATTGRIFPWRSTVQSSVLKLLPNRRGQTTLLTLSRPFTKRSHNANDDQSDTVCSAASSQILDRGSKIRHKSRGDLSDSDESLLIDQPNCSGQPSFLVDPQECLPCSSPPPPQDHLYQTLKPCSHPKPSTVSQWTDEADLCLLKLVVLRQTAPKLKNVNFDRVAQRLTDEGLMVNVTASSVQNRLRTLLFRSARPFNVHKHTKLELLEIQTDTVGPQPSSQPSQNPMTIDQFLLSAQSKYNALDILDAAAVRCDKPRSQTARHWLQSGATSSVDMKGGDLDNRPRLRSPTPPETPTVKAVFRTREFTAPANLSLAHNGDRLVPTLLDGRVKSRTPTQTHKELCNDVTSAPSSSLSFSSQIPASTIKVETPSVDPGSCNDETKVPQDRVEEYGNTGGLLGDARVAPRSLDSTGDDVGIVQENAVNDKDLTDRCDGKIETNHARSARIHKESKRLRTRLQADLLKQSARVQQIALSRGASATAKSIRVTKPETGPVSRKRRARLQQNPSMKSVDRAKVSRLDGPEDEVLPDLVQIEPRDLRYKADRRRRRVEKEARRRRGQIGRIFMVPPPRT